MWLVAAMGAWVILTIFAMNSTAGGLPLAEFRKLAFALIMGSGINWMDKASLPAGRLAPWIGRSGYSIYAMHAPLGYTLIVFGLSWWIAAIIAIVVGICVSIGIEQPMMKLGRAGASRHSVPASDGL